MMNCPADLFFSETHRSKRLQQACDLFGEPTARRLLGYGLFLMGANRQDIAQAVGMPVGTFFSFLNRVPEHRLEAFADRRQRPQPARPSHPRPTAPTVQAHCAGDELVITLPGCASVRLPRSDELGCKLFVLRLVDNGLIATSQAAELLGYSPRHIANLREALQEGGATALLDGRHGQQHDYRFDAPVKAEIIQQFTANLACGDSVASERLAEQIEQRCGLELAPRSIRHHLRKLGLRGIVATFPQLVGTVKKTPDTSERTDR